MAALELGGNAPAFGNRRWRAFPAVATSAFTMTQLASPNRIYQRSTRSGGGQGKGQGVIPVTISGASGGTVNARCRAVDGVTILQAEWQAATIANGATIATIAGVDARLSQFYLDLKDRSGDWKIGTVPIAMGGLIVETGQSYISSRFIRSGAAGDTTTITANGLTVPAEMRLFADVDTNSGAVPSSWGQPSDAGTFNSTGAVELASRMIAQSGIAIGIVVKAQGNTALSHWLPGQTWGDGLFATLAAMGGRCEAVLLGVGANDAQNNLTAYDTLLAQLTTFWAAVDTALGGAGNYSKILLGIPNVPRDGYSMNRSSRMKVNGAFEDWAALNNTTYLTVNDVQISTGDNIHPNQPGNIRHERHTYRAVRSIFGLPGDDRGPKITGIGKSGLNLSLPVNHQSGATVLVAQGNPASRFWIARRGSPTALALDAMTPLTVNPAELLFRLASDPGNVPIEVLPFALHPANDGSADMIFDNHTDGDGIAYGRTMYASPWGFDTRPSATLTVTNPTYSGTAFGGGLSAGYAEAPFPAMPFSGRGATIEFFYKHLANVASNKVILSQLNNFWLAINNGQLVLTNNSIGSTLTVGQTYHIALVCLPANKGAYLFVNGAPAAISAFLVDNISTNFTIRRFAPGNAVADLGATGEVAHLAIFRGPRYLSAFTPPIAEYAGNEPNLLHLWKLQGNGNDRII